MADKADISAKIELDGEKQYRDNLKAVEAELKALKSELDLTASSMDDMTDSQEKNAEQSEALEAIMSKQEDKLKLMTDQYQRQVGELDKLGQALKDAKEEFGQNSTEAGKAQDAYNRQLTSAMNLKTQINKTSQELNDSKKKFQDLSGAADEVKDSFDKVDEAGGKVGSSIKDIFAGNVLANGVSAIAGMVAGMASSFVNLDEATAEVRENLGKVDTAFQTSGKSTDSGRKAYEDFYKILGDSDTAAESAQLLAQLAEDEQDVDKWTRIATGALGTFGDALPINSLIEASNETAKTGTVTGVLADALNWVGISEDEFNEKLAACGSEQERNALITETLAATYEDAAAAYEENNQGLLTARELQAQLDESLAALGGTVQNVKNGLLADFLPAIVQIIDGFNDFVNGVDGAEESLSNGIQMMIDTIIAKLPEFLEFGIKVIMEIVKGIILHLPDIAETAMKLMFTLTKALVGLLPELFTSGVEMMVEIANGSISMLKEFPQIGANLVSGLWAGIKEKSSWLKNQIKDWCGSIVDNVKEFFHINSPSRVFRDEIGQYLPQGLALGIDKGAKVALDSMNTLSNQILNAGQMMIPQISASTQSQSMVESLINGMSMMQDKAVTLVAQVVLPNGEVLAETVFNDLLNVSKQRGVSLA